MNRPSSTHRVAIRAAICGVFLFGFVGIAQAQTATSTAVSSSAGTVTYGISQTFTAVVTAGGTAVTAGTVTFRDTTLGTTLAPGVSLNASGQASASAVLAAGAHTILATYNPDATHFGSSGTTSVTVNKAVLTVTANAVTITYGFTPLFTAALTGFVNNENAGSGVVSGVPSFSTNATLRNGIPNAGAWTITTALGTLTAANYSFSFAGAALTVNKAVLTIVANSVTITAGSNPPPLTATIVGFVNGDFRTPAVLSGDPLLSTTATSQSGPGEYAITVSVGTLSSPNYTFNLVDGVLTVKILVPSSASVTITGGAAQSTRVNTVFAAPLQVTVLDQFGEPIPSAPVTFTAPSSGASLSPDSTEAVANILGVALVYVTANTIAGSYSVTATAGSAPAVTFNLTNNAGAPAKITAAGGTPQTAQIGDTFGAQLSALVQDEFGNPAPGVTVTFTSVSSSNAGATFPAGNTAVTDTAGKAGIDVRANSTPGSYTVTASSGAATTASFNLTNAVPPSVVAPALTSGAANQLGIAWSNTLTKSVTLTLTAHGYDGRSITGNGIQNPVVVTVAAHGQIARQATEIFGAGIAGRSGWVELATSDPGGAGFFLLFDNTLLHCDGGVLVRKPASRLFFPQVNNTTIFHVVNTGSEAIRPAALLVYNNDGNILGNAPLSIESQSGWTGRITDVFPSLGAMDGYAIIDTQGTPFATPTPTLAGMASYQRGGDIAVVMAQDDSARIKNGYVVHIASGAGYTSRLKLVNPDSVEQQLQLTFSGTTGQRPPVQRTIPAFGRLDEALDQMFSLNAGTLTTGFLNFQVSGNSSGVNGFVEIAASGGLLTSQPILAQASTDLFFSHVAQGSGYFTGLAILNPGSSATTVTIEVSATTGAILASRAVTIQPQQRLVGLISELFPAIQNQLGGAVHVTAPQGIYGLQIFGTAGPGGGNFLANIPPGN